MAESEFLGNERVHKQKIYVLLIILGMYAFLFFGLIGATGKSKDILTFYIWFTAILGLIPIFIDIALTRKELPLDTVVHEEETGIRSFKMQLIIGAVLSIIYAFFIFQTGQALIKAPSFGVFDSKSGEAFLSATVGSLETLPFFLVIFPTAYALLSRRFGKLALLMAIGIAVASFTVFHFWAYKYNPIALQSVAVFALINASLLYFFRSAIPLLMIHFVNNWMVVILTLQAYSFFVVV